MSSRGITNHKTDMNAYFMIEIVLTEEILVNNCCFIDECFELVQLSYFIVELFMRADSELLLMEMMEFVANGQPCSHFPSNGANFFSMTN